MKKSDLPLVSVVIPAFNAEATLRATLQSVLSQSYNALEILVVDDGSSDQTPGIVRAFAATDDRIRLISQANGGVARARNTGTAEARGDFVAFVDADDIWHPRKIEFQMREMMAGDERPGFVYAWSRRIDENDCVITDQGRPDCRGRVFEQLLSSNFISNASVVLIRRDALVAAGGFDPGLQEAGAQGAEDIKLYLTIAEREPVALAPYFLVGYREVPSSMSRVAVRMRHSLEMVLNEFERRRPDLPPAVMRAGRMNYDLYAGALALSNRQLGMSLRFIGSAFAREPLISLALLSSEAAWRCQKRLASRGHRPHFYSLAPEEVSTRLPLYDWINRLKTLRGRRCATRASQSLLTRSIIT
jgi:glycosyltransferase involved in cell wall biosynthesis